MGNWRSSFNSPFMAAWDIDKPVILTIKNVEQKVVQLQKSEEKVIAVFLEKKFEDGEDVKPMILNSTNCKMLNKATKSNDTKNWVNLKVEIGVVANKGRIGNDQGLSILRVLSTAPVQAVVLEELVVGSDSWNKVINYVKDSKHLGLSVIVKNLETKYRISTAVKKELSTFIS